MNKPLQNRRSAIWILGLHHSGTTIVWRTFRSDERFLCYDEPLTDSIGDTFPDNNHKKTFDEYLRLFGNNPESFWNLYETITPHQELDSEFTAKQRAYLTYLLNTHDRVVIDETHLHEHLPGIKELTPDGQVIHLFRRASGFVTSHLRPTWSRKTSPARLIVRYLRHQYNKHYFWTRTDYLPGMRRGNVIGDHPQSKFGLMLAAAGYNVDEIMAAPSLVKLLAYWHYQYHHISIKGPQLFGENFIPIRFEDFANQPRPTLEHIYDRIGFASKQNIKLPAVHPPKPAYCEGDKRWTDAARIAGFSEEELTTLL